ncbi:CHAD domain-containing protein [Luteolibacter sp. GHJ8]|uniref:CHAD domain-containing protein n=1 Tax=Luteolibacter rhizosphaerae TaxID=2989719 RepID=A0ABT3G4J2_9BACT|nr:CHAD domain-containing protein [Luteolibacter rhizosphaerae]MCW1914469.1 CHAD domain-containing protein [Luteolibacter rhizosphaerae]
MSASSDSEAVFSGARAALLAACDEMERRLHGLVDSHGKVAEEIHQLRKLGKRLRGALAMVGEPKPCIRWIAVIGRMLGGSRDSMVRAKTWRSLGVDSTASGAVETAIRDLLDLEADASIRKPPAGVTEWSLAAVKQVKARIESQSDAEVAVKAAKGAALLRRRLKRRLKKALDRVTNEDFHDCRKAAKAWLGGLSIVAASLAVPAQEETEKLAGNLGDENDLEVLAVWLESRGFSPATAKTPWKVLRKRQEKIRRRSISLIRKDLLPALTGKGKD